MKTVLYTAYGSDTLDGACCRFNLWFILFPANASHLKAMCCLDSLTRRIIDYSESFFAKVLQCGRALRHSIKLQLGSKEKKKNLQCALQVCAAKFRGM